MSPPIVAHLSAGNMTGVVSKWSLCGQSGGSSGGGGGLSDGKEGWGGGGGYSVKLHLHSTGLMKIKGHISRYLSGALRYQKVLLLCIYLFVVLTNEIN